MTNVKNTNSYASLESQNSRKVLLPKFMEIAGVESDENVRSIKFKFPKIVDGVDLTEMQLKINYMNGRQEKGQYIVTDLVPYPFDENYVTFSWNFSRLVTRYRGVTKFIVCAVKTDDDGKIVTEWNTSLSQIRVLEGLEVEDPEISPEEKDVIAELISICQSSADEAAASAKKAEEEAEKVFTYGLSIGENGNWYLGEEDTGKPSRGENGFSPDVKLSTIENGVRVTITDKDGAESFDILDGDKVQLTSGDLFSPPPETVKLENTRVRNGIAETVAGWYTYHVPMSNLKTGMIIKTSPSAGAYYGYYQQSDESYTYTHNNVLGVIFPDAEKDGFYVSLQSETFPEFYINAKSGVIDKKPVRYKGFRGIPATATFSNRSLFCFDISVPRGVYLAELPFAPNNVLYGLTGNNYWSVSTSPVKSTNAPAQIIGDKTYVMIANITDEGFGMSFRASTADGVKSIQSLCENGFNLYKLSDFDELVRVRNALPISTVCHMANFTQDYMLACALGWGGIELDVRKTMDGVYVLSHDASVSGKVISETNYADFKSAVPYISTLEECLAFVSQFNCHVDVHMGSLTEWERLQCLKSITSHGIKPWYYTDMEGNIGTILSKDFCKTGIAAGVGVNPPTDTQYYGNYILWKEPDSQSQESMMNWMFINDGATDMGYDYLVNTDFKGATYFFGYRKSDKLLYIDPLSDTGM